MKLEKYGSITVSTRGYFYLSLDGFKSGDTLYFEGSYTSYDKFTYITIHFREADVLDYSDASIFEHVKSSSYSQSGSHITYYFSYTLKGNNKYLLIVTPNFDPYKIDFTLEHTKGNNLLWIIIAVVAIFVIAIIIVVICRCRRGCC